MTTLAIDIGGTKVLTALVRDHAVIEARRAPTDMARGPDALVETVAGLAAPWNGRYRAVGAAVSGLVRDGRWRALNRATLDLPVSYPLRDRLEARLRAPAHVANDAQAAAWGEFVAGAGAGEDMVFLTISTGIGGGVVCGGRLLQGLAGHFGQFVDGAGTRLEDSAAGRWLASEAAARGEPGDAAAVFAAADAGAAWAVELVATSAARVAVLCRNVQLAVDPARIAIGGGIGLAPGYLDRLRAAFADLDPDLAPRLVPSALGAEAGVIGAAALAGAMPPRTLRETAR